ncbi:MAG: argininosuccinate lyase [Thermaerobacter sp.]|nr:argininosuccinate lyase [Thermaerobacter sp.]
MGVARSPRLKAALDQRAASFTASLFFDWRLLPYDVTGSIAHVTMLAEAGVVSRQDCDSIVAGLQTVREEWEAGALQPRLEWEDVHMNVEGRLSELIGPVAGKLHTGRSRNDQVALDMHLYLKDVGHQMSERLVAMISALAGQAKATSDVIIPGYTHLQAAQPVLLSHHFLAYADMLRRDYDRLRDWLIRTDRSPLGAGALSGTPYPTRPERTAELLGLADVYRNSLDAVSDRDFLLEFLAWAAILMVHLSRLGEELVLWSSQEFGYLTMDDRYATGSSMMPQKKNPDVAELVRGKAGRVFGHLSGLLVVMKGLPLAYHSDMQEDKESVFDVVDTVGAVLTVATGMIETLRVNRDRIRMRLGHDFTGATDLADMMVQHGVPFREAHHLVGDLVARLERDAMGFENVTEEYLARYAPTIPRAWLDELTPDAIVARRRQAMGTAPESVAGQVANLEKWLKRAVKLNAKTRA